MSRMEISISPKLLARSRILLKIVVLDHSGHMFRLRISFVPIIVARSKIFTQNCHFWIPRICWGWKLKLFQKCMPFQGFCTKLSFLTTADMSRMKISISPKILERSRILLKNCHFHHCGHVEDENVNISKIVGPFKDFAQNCLDHRRHVKDGNFNFPKTVGLFKDFDQNCHFWPLWTCQGWKFKAPKNFGAI